MPTLERLALAPATTTLSGPGDWWPAVRLRLLAADTVAVAAGLSGAMAFRAGPAEAAIGYRGGYLALPVVLGVAWLLGIALHGGYLRRHLGSGPAEYKSLASATFRLFGVMAIASYLLRVPIPRGLIAVALPVGLAGLLIGRFAVRRWIVSARLHGRCSHRVLVVGDRRRVEDKIARLCTEPHAGFVPVGVCLSDPEDRRPIEPGVPVLGGLASIREALQASGADTVVVTEGPAVDTSLVREIAWSLEGDGVDLIVSPSLADVAGPRVSVRPLGGLPLLHVDEPQLSGGSRLVKRLMDVVGAALALVLLSPVLLVAALAVRLSGQGPVFFRQTRVGRGGAEFRVFKFRTMYADAEARLDELLDRNETDGLLFKIRQDPRITPVGRFLRRTSIDELPQLLNVLLGDMSLVGPRPLPVRDGDFTGHVRRRLLVLPGITGLWQVSGRSDISWEDAVRLDLYYVENWSLTLDLLIMLRTVHAVLRGGGAY